jgi:hypothetical protein
MVGLPIELDAFYMLLYGDTWYGKHGFVPFDEINKTDDEFMMEKYNENKNIVMNTNIADIDMKALFKYGIDKANTKLKENKKPIINITDDMVNSFVNEYKNKSITVFMRGLAKNYDKTCIIFFYMYKKLMGRLKMNNLHGVVYWKKI